jgi:putative ABC transport system substrate-binding protein
MGPRRYRPSRRQFVQGVGRAGLALVAGGCWSRSSSVEQPPTPARVGYLASASQPPSDAFLQGMHDLGYRVGGNLTIVYRAADNDPERFRQVAAELVALRVDVILVTGTPGALAAREATTTIPIVMAAPGDPVASGLVASLARPGGNVTGLSQLTPQLGGKRLELLKEAVPAVSHVAVLANPTNPANRLEWEEAQPAARVLGLQLQLIEVRGPEDARRTLEAATKNYADGLIVFSAPMLNVDRSIVSFAAESRLPAMYAWYGHMERGGLMSYGPNPADLFRRAATYVHKILQGASPADLPVEQPTRFDFAINLQTAQALGLAIPPRVLAQATEVIP